jgi:hypothetical protein
VVLLIDPRLVRQELFNPSKRIVLKREEQRFLNLAIQAS